MKEDEKKDEGKKRGKVKNLGERKRIDIETLYNITIARVVFFLIHEF